MQNNKIINVDTDSILICKEDQSPWNKQEQKLFLEALNAQFPEKIKFEHDGIFESVLVLASKNYALLPEGGTKIKIKGSSLKDAKREPAVKEMIDSIIHAFIHGQKDQVLTIYEKYVDEVMNLKDISRWSSKKTATEPVLRCKDAETRIEQISYQDPTGLTKIGDKKVYYKNGRRVEGIRPNEMNIWEAIKMEPLVQSGDKFFVYPAVVDRKVVTTSKILKSGKEKITEKEVVTYGLKQPKHFNNDHDKEHLLKRLFNTIEIFESVIDDMSQFKNYALAKNYKQLVDRYQK
jgi:hypothetical protein